MSNIILTGDRPTGRLHLGHYVGSLRRRVELQNGGDFDRMYVMVADAQALTDNYSNVQKVRDNITEVALDYLSCGIDPDKVCIFIQSQVAALCELTFYFMNLVTLSRLERNPTVKNEIKLRGFETSLPTGFLTYPISQASDILAFNANIVPVGDDQLPMLEQTREIARSFNSLYGEVFVEPEALLPASSVCARLPGTDGGGKMSKSLGNCIYLADTADEVKAKVMNMFTDPNHLKVSDPGNVDDNPVFIYLQAFCRDVHFERYLKDYANLGELEEHYRRGGLGDMKVKRFLNDVLQEELEPIRAKRAAFTEEYVFDMLRRGSEAAAEAADETLDSVKTAMGINYFK
ncbi:tryptophan--tRNA ligase [Clostridia bacterium]|nr:tryptophan--tRNA ligase [Clostridia bacterium]